MCEPWLKSTYLPNTAKFTWRQLAGMLRRAADGKEDAAEVATALQIVLKIEGVEYRTS